MARIREGDPYDATTIKDEFGPGVKLDAEDLPEYKGAVRDGFIELVGHVNPRTAKVLTTQFEKGAEIEDKASIVQRKFMDLLTRGEWRSAIELKQGFAPGIMCDRVHVAGYDHAFYACLSDSLARSSVGDVRDPDTLYEKLGEGVDILGVLRKLKDEDECKFTAFAKRDHWRAIFGETAFGELLEALPKRTDEKRNAFTHNAYDRTTNFVQFLLRTGNLSLDEEGFALMTDFVKRFGLSRSQNLVQCFWALKQAEKGQSLPNWIAEAGFTSVDDIGTRIKVLRQKVYGTEPVFDFSGLGTIELELLAVVTGKSTHRFDSGNPPIAKIVSDFQKAHAAGEIAEVPEGYQAESIEAPEVSIDFDPEPIRTDYETLKSEILQSVEQPEDITSLRQQCLHVIDEKLETLKGKDATPFITAQISKLELLCERIEAVRDLNALMVVLIDTKFMGNKNPLYSVMRQIIFRQIFIKNRSPEAMDDMVARLKGDAVTGPNILEIIGIVEETVKHHVLNLAGDNKEGYWDLSTWHALCDTRTNTGLVDVLKIFSPHIGKLKEASTKFKLTETGGTAEVRSIPDRGFVGEMSGYLADVCYTAEYPLLKERPNLIPRKFVVGEGEEAEFFGSYLIFELEEDIGEKVMLVRGFNVPNEASIDITKFIETNMDRLEATARRRGITKIVIPGEMGALSNYPLTKNYLSNRYINEKQPIKLKEHFEFNGYDLTENCFVIREIEPQVADAPFVKKRKRKSKIRAGRSEGPTSQRHRQSDISAVL